MTHKAFRGKSARDINRDADRDAGDEGTSLPARFDAILERVTERDRAYFERHPTARRYTRLYVPGEFWPKLGGGDLMVTVYQPEPGVRMRYVHRIDQEPPDEIPLDRLRSSGPEFERLLRKRLADEARRCQEKARGERRGTRDD